MTEQSATANPLDSAEVFTMDKDEALKKFREYADAARMSRRKQDAVMRDVFHALSQGRGVINVPAAIKKGGVSPKTGLPLLAILRADEREVWFKRIGPSGGRYGCRQYLTDNRNSTEANKMRQFNLPDDTLPMWSQIPLADRVAQRSDKSETYARYTPSGYWDVHRAPAPVIPPRHRPTLPLSQHWLLWHVEEWRRVAPVDPMLILPFGANGLGVVVAHWDLTPVERMVMGALLGQ